MKPSLKSKFLRSHFLFLALSAAAASAEDTWLQPERFAATPGATLMLDLMSSDAFSQPGMALKPERVQRVVGRLGGRSLFIAQELVAEQSLRFPATFIRPGLAVLGVELKPERLEFAADEIEQKLRDIHASLALRATWEAVPEPRRWRENTVGYAKAFVRVGEPPPSERAWSEPLGFFLEIVPECDPTAMRAGDELAVRVLRGGEPLAGFTLNFISEGLARERVSVTDEEGRARAKLDVRGLWLLHGIDLRRSRTPNVEWESGTTTLVVEVK